MSPRSISWLDRLILAFLISIILCLMFSSSVMVRVKLSASCAFSILSSTSRGSSGGGGGGGGGVGLLGGGGGGEASSS